MITLEDLNDATKIPADKIVEDLMAMSPFLASIMANMPEPTRRERFKRRAMSEIYRAKEAWDVLRGRAYALYY